MKSRQISDVILYTKNLIKHADKIAYLRQNGNVHLYYFLWVALSGKVQWLLPEGTPPFTPHRGRPGSEPSTINRELRRLYVFLNGTGNNLAPHRRERIFQQILESLSADEVDLLVAVKDGTFEKTYRCPKKVVEEAFPGLFDAPFTNYFIKPA